MSYWGVVINSRESSLDSHHLTSDTLVSNGESGPCFVDPHRSQISQRKLKQEISFWRSYRHFLCRKKQLVGLSEPDCSLERRKELNQLNKCVRSTEHRPASAHSANNVDREASLESVFFIKSVF